MSASPLLTPRRRIIVRRPAGIATPTTPSGHSRIMVPRLATPAPAQERPQGRGETIFNHPSSPIAYTTKPFDVDLLAGGRLLGPPNETLLMNEGPAALSITLGGHTYSLAPWDRHIFPCNGSAAMHVDVVSLTSPLPTAPSSSLLVSIAPQGTSFPGVPSAASRHVVQYAQPDDLGSVVATAGNTNTKSFPLPSGAISIGYGVDFSGSNAAATNVTITGDQTKTVYRNDANPGTPPVRAALLMPNETSVTVSVTAGAVNPAQADVFSWPVPVTSTVTPDIATPTPVTFRNVAAGFNAQAAPWQSPSSRGVVNGSNVNASASFTFIAGVAATQIWLHWALFSSNAAPAASNSWLFQDTASIRFASTANNTQQDNNPILNKDFKGLALASGNGATALNQTGGALALYGSGDYALQ